MLPTQQPVLRRFWYPVMPTGRLDAGPQPFTLLGEAIVVWRKPDGGLAAIADRCCHRTAKLSLGYLEGGNIVCGYHGWTFDGTGKCVRIPQRENPENTGRIAVDGYKAVERYGHVWVALGEPLCALPQIPEAEEAGFRRIDQFYEEWAIGALRLMENSFDVAHPAFVHRSTFGDTSRPLPPVMPTVVEGPWGFDYFVESEVSVRGSDAADTLKVAEGTTTRRRTNSWYMPFVRRLGITYPNGLRHTIVTAATPMTDDRTMLVQFCFRNDTEEMASTEQVIAFDRKIIEEDRRILEGCSYDVPLAVVDGEEFHMPSDRPGLAMRRKLRELLEAHGEQETRATPSPAPIAAE
jgi:phenylpropionate dioxygenase-like ring-hydroxylating dioxygenase large terminal subunit